MTGMPAAGAAEGADRNDQSARHQDDAFAASV